MIYSLKYFVSHTHTHTHTTILWPFAVTTQVSRCQKKSSGLYGAREDNDNLAGATPSGLISDRSPSSPHFYARCPSFRNPPNLSWLGTGTKYACLHTQRLGFHVTYLQPFNELFVRVVQVNQRCPLF